MTNQASPVEEQEKLLDEALNVVKVQVYIGSYDNYANLIYTIILIGILFYC